MTIPATHDLLAVLDRLESTTADDLETQWLEFKPWQSTKDDMRIAVEYATRERCSSVTWPTTCRELLGLGDSNSARVEVSRHLRSWSAPTGFLRREGERGPKVRYFFAREY